MLRVNTGYKKKKGQDIVECVGEELKDYKSDNDR